MYNNDAQRCLTGEVRLSYVNLDKPRQPQGGVGDAKYSATLLIDPESLRTTAKWEKSFYESREKGKFIVCTRCRHAFSKKGLWCRKYRPECGARMEDPDHV